MVTQKSSNKARLKRHKRMRRNINGTALKPRLNVFRSLNHIYAQVIDDVAGVTLVAASSLEAELKDTYCGNRDGAFEIGKLIAKKALEKGIDTVVFDRGGYLYHGRVASLADGAREGGLQF